MDLGSSSPLAVVCLCLSPLIGLFPISVVLQQSRVLLFCAAVSMVISGAAGAGILPLTVLCCGVRKVEGE